MKIIHIIFSFRVGGTETMLVDLLHNQQNLGNKISILIINNLYDEQLISNFDKKINVVKWNREPGANPILLGIRLNIWLRIKNFDVIHIHNHKLAGLIRGMDTKLIYTVHALDIPQKYLRPKIQQIAITNAVKTDVIQMNPDARITTIYNGIRIKDLLLREQYVPKLHKPFKIVQVARLDTAKKGQDILINAVDILHNRNRWNDIYVDFIGEGKDLEYLKNLVAKKGLTKQIRFHGLKTRKEIYHMYANYDLMVHPARYEGFGLVIAEALAACLPVAVPHEGGPFEIIGEGKYGITFLHNSPEDVAKSIEYARLNYNKLLSKAVSSRKITIESYSILSMAYSYLRLYHSLKINKN